MMEPFDAVLAFLSQFDSDDLVVSTPAQLLSPLVQTGADDFHWDELFKNEKQSTGTDMKRSEDSSTSSDDSGQTTVVAKPKRIRISRKQQIDSLRTTVQELKDELASLSSSQVGTGDHQRESMWQEVAARQQQRRHQSEMENAELRAMLEIQLQEAKNLKRVLKRRNKIDMLENMLGVKKHKTLLYEEPTDNPQVFEHMLQDTDELYVGVDALFVEKGVVDLPCPGRSRIAKRNVTDGLFLELSQRHAMPFGLQESAKALWKALCQIGFEGMQSIGDIAKRVRFHGYHADESSDTMKISFFAETINLGDVKGARFRKIVRKYVDQDRVVFICKNLMEPILFDTNEPSGFHSSTTLQLVVRRHDRQTPQTEGTSIVESYFNATRFSEGLPAAKFIPTAPNLDVGIAAWDEAISRIVHQVENIVIDNSSKLPSREVLTT